MYLTVYSDFIVKLHQCPISIRKDLAVLPETLSKLALLAPSYPLANKGPHYPATYWALRLIPQSQRFQLATVVWTPATLVILLSSNNLFCTTVEDGHEFSTMITQPVFQSPAHDTLNLPTEYAGESTGSSVTNKRSLPSLSRPINGYALRHDRLPHSI